MSDVQTLIAKCRKLGAILTPTPEGKLKVRAPEPLPDDLRGALRSHKAEVLHAIQDREKKFLVRTVPSAVLEVFPDFRGVLVASTALEMSVWIVRTPEDGERLARDTGHPSLCLDDLIAQIGKNSDDARLVVFPLLITGQEQ